MAGLQCFGELAFEDKIIDDNNCEVKSSFSMSNYINIYIHIIQTPEANLSEGGGVPQLSMPIICHFGKVTTC